MIHWTLNTWKNFLRERKGEEPLSGEELLGFFEYWEKANPSVAFGYGFRQKFHLSD
jgi:hypothetical protein